MDKYCSVMEASDQIVTSSLDCYLSLIKFELTHVSRRCFMDRELPVFSDLYAFLIAPENHLNIVDSPNPRVDGFTLRTGNMRTLSKTLIIWIEEIVRMWRFDRDDGIN